MKIKDFILGTVSTNCYVVSDETKNCVIIDCDGSGEELFNYMDENNLNPTHILLTHGHFDHTGAVKPLKKRYPDIKICIGENDKELLFDIKKSFARMAGDKDRIIEADIYFKDGDTLNVGNMEFKVIETPGHTKGGVCYLVEDALFSGDTLFAGDCGRVDLYGGSWPQMQESLRRLANLEGDLKVLSGHGPSSTLDFERKNNQYMK